MSDEQPHTHEVEILQCYDDTWQVKYGDTRVNLFFNKKRPPSEARLRRAITKAIRKHDEGSVQYGRREQIKNEFAAKYNKTLPDRSEWASELLGFQKRDAG